MDFQTTLPYAVDSDLHVIAGLDVSGIPIFQRPGDYRFLPVDMYTLLQGIIERCLATQRSDGSYLVSPVIYDETIGLGKFASISKWTERTYPDGTLNEISGYVANLMDNYPTGLLLAAIDDKIWELGSCSSGVHEEESCYGNWDDTTKTFSPFFPDATAFMYAAGVGYDPVSFEMQCIPARVTGGDPVYGSPSGLLRIYPELLIDRYKLLQVMRYMATPLYDLARQDFYGGESYMETGTYPSDPRPQFYPGGTFDMLWYDWYKETACYKALPLFLVKLNDPNSWGAAEYTGMTMNRYYGSYYQHWAMYQGACAWIFSLIETSPCFKMWGYADIPKNFMLTGLYAGGNNSGLKTWDEHELVIGRNELRRWINPMEHEEFDNSEGFPYDFDYVWNAATPNGHPPATMQITNIGVHTDFKFQFCKHDDNGGAVTWVP
jgi:hypothetical protein